MVIVILGILAATALPRFINLSANAKQSAAKGALGAIRAAIAIQYASSATGASGIATYPSTVTEAMFADSQVPTEPYSNSNSITLSASAPTAAGSGWRYDSANGRVWINDSAYSSY